MEKELTDEEIVNALDKCRERPYCEVKCEYKLARTGAECIPKLMGIALDLINRQKAEIERLTEEKWQVQDDLDNYHAMYREEVKAKDELLDELIDKRGKMDKAQQEVYIYQDRNAELQKQVEAWKARAKELEQTWEISSSNEEKLQKQVDELKSQNEWLTNENDYLKQCADAFLGDYKNSVKDTAKEIYAQMLEWMPIGEGYSTFIDNFEMWIKERYGVEVE